MGALSAAAAVVLAPVGLWSQAAAFVKSDVMAELSQLRVCGQTSQPFCVLLSEQSDTVSSLPTLQFNTLSNCFLVGWRDWWWRVFMSL